ncbi:MAG: hypothetical protein M3275_10665 [Thermoproteota archaeon]|nr:hypothetical protein [Thermoproteota archaeon]
MAVVKASFTKARGGAKASVRYIAFRPGKDDEKISRKLFGHDGTLSIHQADRMIDEASKGTIYFRFAISPDPKTEDAGKDLHLWELTLQTVQALEERIKREVQFVAAEHNDHSPNRHVHVIALVPGRLGVADLEAMTQAATEAAFEQRQELDLAAASEQGRGAAPQRPIAQVVQMAQGRAYRPLEGSRQRYGQLKPVRPVQACHLCGHRVGKNYTRCGNCGARLEFSLDLGDNEIAY